MSSKDELLQMLLAAYRIRLLGPGSHLLVWLLDIRDPEEMYVGVRVEGLNLVESGVFDASG